MQARSAVASAEVQTLTVLYNFFRNALGYTKNKNSTFFNPSTPRPSYGEMICHPNFLICWQKSYHVTIHMKPLWQNFCIGLFISTDFTKRNLEFLVNCLLCPL